jgi:hypothetical protein
MPRLPVRAPRSCASVGCAGPWRQPWKRPRANSDAFPAPEAFALAQKLEPHYTPKKGRWLNMAAIELAALAKQCLERRIGDMETLSKEVRAWERKRNALRATGRWGFTKDVAREKFRRYYHQN